MPYVMSLEGLRGRRAPQLMGGPNTMGERARALMLRTGLAGPIRASNGRGGLMGLGDLLDPFANNPMIFFIGAAVGIAAAIYGVQLPGMKKG